MSTPLWCVVARNRLTGEREVVSRPLPRDKAEEIRIKYTNFRGTKKPYTHPKVVPYNPNLDIPKKIETMPFKVQYDIYDTQHTAPIISTTDATMARIEFNDLLRKGNGFYRMQQTPMAVGQLTKSEEYLMLVYNVRKLWKQYFNQGRSQEVLKTSLEEEKKLDDWHKRVSVLSKNNNTPLPIKDREAFDFFIVVRGWRDAWKDRKNYSKRRDCDEDILKEMSKKCRDFEKKIDQYIIDKLQLI